MKYTFRCDCIVNLAQLVEHVEGSLMRYVCTTIRKISIYLVNHGHLGIFKPFIWHNKHIFDQ